MSEQPAIDYVAKVLFMRYYIHREDASEKWATSYWSACAYAPHKGDCPHAELKGPITCDRCVCDEFRADAMAVLDALNSPYRNPDAED